MLNREADIGLPVYIQKYIETFILA